MTYFKCSNLNALIKSNIETTIRLGVPYPKNIGDIQRIYRACGSKMERWSSGDMSDISSSAGDINSIKLPFSLIREKLGGAYYFCIWGILWIVLAIFELIFNSIMGGNTLTIVGAAVPWRIVYEILNEPTIFYISKSIIYFIFWFYFYSSFISKVVLGELVAILLSSKKLEKYSSEDSIGEDIISFKNPRKKDYLIGIVYMLIFSLPAWLIFYFTY